jgi:hypothetical protein
MPDLEDDDPAALSPHICSKIEPGVQPYEIEVDPYNLFSSILDLSPAVLPPVPVTYDDTIHGGLRRGFTHLSYLRLL